MTLNAEFARAKVDEEIEKQKTFDYKYPLDVKRVDKTIEEAVSKLLYSCTIIFSAARPNSFFDELKEYYEKYGYKVKISEEIDGFFRIERFPGYCREVTLSW